jgi:hypothetical protein
MLGLLALILFIVGAIAFPLPAIAICLVLYILNNA